jgi:hypothetical protein
MAAIKSQHSRVFERLIGAYRQKLVEAVIGGVADTHYPQLLGEIRGIDAALKMSEEADFKLSGDFNVDGS